MYFLMSLACGLGLVKAETLAHAPNSRLAPFVHPHHISPPGQGSFHWPLLRLLPLTLPRPLLWLHTLLPLALPWEFSAVSSPLPSPLILTLTSVPTDTSGFRSGKIGDLEITLLREKQQLLASWMVPGGDYSNGQVVRRLRSFSRPPSTPWLLLASSGRLARPKGQSCHQLHHHAPTPCHHLSTPIHQFHITNFMSPAPRHQFHSINFMLLTM